MRWTLYSEFGASQLQRTLPFVNIAREFLFPFSEFEALPGQLPVDLTDLRAARLTVGPTDPIVGAALDANLVGVLFVQSDEVELEPTTQLPTSTFFTSTIVPTPDVAAGTTVAEDETTTEAVITTTEALTTTEEVTTTAPRRTRRPKTTTTTRRPPHKRTTTRPRRPKPRTTRSRPSPPPRTRPRQPRTTRPRLPYTKYPITAQYYHSTRRTTRPVRIRTTTRRQHNYGPYQGQGNDDHYYDDYYDYSNYYDDDGSDDYFNGYGHNRQHRKGGKNGVPGCSEWTLYEGRLFKYCRQHRNWFDANAHCRDKGGHLASLLSDTELRSVVALWGADPHVPVWIGAKRQHANGAGARRHDWWSWADNVHFGFERWAQEADLIAMGTDAKVLRHDCATIGHTRFGYARRWFTRPCDTSQNAFLCSK